MPNSFSDPPRITLASTSPRRRELLDQIQVSYETFPVNIDESLIEGETAKQFVERLAQKKARAGFNAYPTRPSLGSDTVVVYQQKILGKPENEQQAFQMLQLLSGNCHQVMTAVAICQGDVEHCAVSISAVEFACLSDQQISTYWQTGEPMDKAGGYGIQGIAAQFVKRINGSYSGVMGLPLYETSQLLKRVNIELL